MSDVSVDPGDLAHEFMVWWAGPGNAFDGASFALVQRACNEAFDEDELEAYAFVELEGTKYLLLLMSARGVAFLRLQDDKTVECRLVGQLHGDYREEWRVADGDLAGTAVFEHEAIPGNRLQLEIDAPRSPTTFLSSEAARRRKMLVTIRKQLRVWATTHSLETG